jgi:hypothetical protein
MNMATIIVILLSHQGYWLSGMENQISVQWSAKAGMPAADLRWELLVSNVKIDSGQTPMLPENQPTSVKIIAPQVRVRTTLVWKYVLVRHDGGQELDRGERTIDVFPDNLADGLAKRVGDSQIVVWETGGKIAAFFDRAKTRCTKAADPDNIMLSKPDVVLVGADTLDGLPGSQDSLVGLAQGGASIMVFRQSRVEQLAGYKVAHRDAPAELDRLPYHPLLSGFDRKMFDSIITMTRLDQPIARPIRLPADEPALAIIQWPREIPGDTPIAIDALLVSKTVGKGRIVFCQLPLTDFKYDPRAAMLLVNAVDYLLSPVEPTPRPSQRPATQPTEPKKLAPITIQTGNEP